MTLSRCAAARVKCFKSTRMRVSVRGHAIHVCDKNGRRANLVRR